MDCIGNISLLDLEMHGFLCSQCTKSSVILPCLDWAVERAHSTEPVMSTFHSEMESAVLDMLLRGTCPIILVLGRRPYKVLPERLQQALNDNRLLVISVSDQTRISRESALACNEYICKHSTTLTFGFLSPDSSLYPLYEEAIKTNKHIDVICHPTFKVVTI